MSERARRPRICHWRRGEVLMTWCGRHTQKVLTAGQRAAVTCIRCLRLEKQAERDRAEEPR